MFDFGKSINIVNQRTEKEVFEGEGVRYPKISNKLSKVQKEGLLKTLFVGKSAFVTVDETFGFIKGHEVEISLTVW